MTEKTKTTPNTYVTKPFLAPLKDYNDLLKDIWDCGILTNDGQFVNRFENLICKKFGLSNYITFSSGTTALQAAIKGLQLEGEIITTAFTWIATVSAIKNERCKPIFCDIDEDTLNIDIKKIENHITDKTVAIMPVHVFGNPCDIDGIKKIANRYRLKVIYDAAHAIGSEYNGKSILSYGDVSVLSTHATKLLNTGEGGGCVAGKKIITEKLKGIRFFGYNKDKSDIQFDGLNGKLTELQSALGIVNLKYIDKVISDRKIKYQYYYSALRDIPALSFQKIEFGKTNYSYFPIIIESKKKLFKLIDKLNNHNIYPRRYFYPSVNIFKNIVDSDERKISEKVANHVLCLPLFYDLDFDIIDQIISLVKKEI
ncbi:MAG: DegT/DnrJ/EryC1/StrS family aminotransferase [bacterium TMED46]|mgnify:CR=1 FL=1|nr:MAG: DegT/DnrJ/EryC1/StrS family aminotransferase [bacterium TMED46]